MRRLGDIEDAARAQSDLSSSASVANSSMRLNDALLNGRRLIPTL
jgi:hypothetical protein